MGKLLKTALILCTLLFSLSAGELAYEINFMNNAPRLSGQTIQTMVDNALCSEIDKHPYYQARVNVYIIPESTDDHLVVYLFRSDIYYAPCFRLDVENQQVTAVVEDYVEEQPDNGICPTCPDPDIQVLLSCATPEYPSGPRCMENVKKLAEDEGLKAVYLDKSNETLTKIKDYLTCPNLIMWARVGHGTSSGILLGSGSFNTSAVNSLEGDKLQYIRLHFNSCDCHTGSFEQSILDAGAYFYCGGDISLAVGRSEDVTLRFMEKIITDQKEVEPSITAAMDEIGYRNSFGLSGCDEKPWLWWPNLDPYISVSSPNGGDEFEQGTVQTITWGDNIDGNVKIELFKGGSLKETLTASTESDGKFDWNIAGNYQVGTDYKVKITSIDSTALFDESNDNFSVTPEYIITAFPYIEDFDDLTNEGTVLPKKWEQLSSDDLDWIVLNGPTPSKVGSDPDKTGPDNDHTSGSGNYIYVEASGSSNSPDKKADFTTCKIKLNNLTGPELSFYGHMFSANSEMGDLYLDICVDGNWSNDVLHLTDDHGDQWFEQKLDLTPYKGDRVIFRFRAITGASWCSDICIDDFTIDGQMAIDNTVTGAHSAFSLKFINSKVHFSIPENGNQLRVALYNLQGKMIKTLASGRLKAGNYAVPVNELAAGLFVCKIETKEYTKAIPILIQK